MICDRFSDSTRVYQCDAGGLPLDVFNALEQMVVTLTFPDLTFILDVPAEVGLSRAATRRLAQALSGEAPDAFEKRDVEFHERLREGYLAIAKAEPHRCQVIDGTAEPDVDLRADLGTGGAPHAGAAALMARAPAVQEIEALPEADRLDDFPHPRQTRALFGHEAVEAELAAGRSRAGACITPGCWPAARASARRRWPIVWRGMCWRGRRSAIPLGQSLEVPADSTAARQVGGPVASGAAGAAPALRHARQALRDQHSRRRGAAAEIVPGADGR